MSIAPLHNPACPSCIPNPTSSHRHHGSRSCACAANNTRALPLAMACCACCCTARNHTTEHPSNYSQRTNTPCRSASRSKIVARRCWKAPPVPCDLPNPYTSNKPPTDRPRTPCPSMTAPTAPSPLAHRPQQFPNACMLVSPRSFSARPACPLQQDTRALAFASHGVSPAHAGPPRRACHGTSRSQTNQTAHLAAGRPCRGWPPPAHSHDARLTPHITHDDCFDAVTERGRVSQRTHPHPPMSALTWIMTTINGVARHGVSLPTHGVLRMFRTAGVWCTTTAPRTPSIPTVPGRRPVHAVLHPQHRWE